jgi:hypothetical protein
MFPAGSVTLVARPRPSTSNVVFRCKPPPDGVDQPVGRAVKSLVWVVWTSTIDLVTAPVPMS